MSIETKVILTCDKCQAKVEYPSQGSWPPGWFEIHRTNEPRSRAEVRQCCKQCLATFTVNAIFGKPPKKWK